MAVKETYSIMGKHPGDGGFLKARDPEEAIALFLSEGDIDLFGEIFGEALINGEEKADGSFVLGDYIVRKI